MQCHQYMVRVGRNSRHGGSTLQAFAIVTLRSWIETKPWKDVGKDNPAIRFRKPIPCDSGMIGGSTKFEAKIRLPSRAGGEPQKLEKRNNEHYQYVLALYVSTLSSTRKLYPSISSCLRSVRRSLACQLVSEQHNAPILELPSAL